MHRIWVEGWWLLGFVPNGIWRGFIYYAKVGFYILKNIIKKVGGKKGFAYEATFLFRQISKAILDS